MLENTEFSITLREDALDFESKFYSILNLYAQIHISKEMLFNFKADSNKVILKDLHPKINDNCYPLDVLLPMIKYKTMNITEIIEDNPYNQYDSSIPAYRFYIHDNGLHIIKIYLYASK